MLYQRFTDLNSGLKLEIMGLQCSSHLCLWSLGQLIEHPFTVSVHKERTFFLGDGFLSASLLSPCLFQMMFEDDVISQGAFVHGHLYLCGFEIEGWHVEQECALVAYPRKENSLFYKGLQAYTQGIDSCLVNTISWVDSANSYKEIRGAVPPLFCYVWDSMLYHNISELIALQKSEQERKSL